jgi:hypothetical protein
MAIVPLSRELHAKKRLRPLPSFAFAKNLPVVRALAGEIAQIAANYPVVFIEENGALVPFAMVGLAPGENLFVSDDGQWLGYYIPAMLRRYPFMMGKAPEGAEGGNAMLLLDDEMLSDDEGEPLFGPEGTEGEPQGPVARAIQLLTQIELQAAQTAALAKSLADAGLLTPLPLQVTRGAEGPLQLGGIHTINEAKLNELPDEAFLALRRTGALGLAHAQLISLAQLPRLQARASAKMNNTAMPVV